MWRKLYMMALTKRAHSIVFGHDCCVYGVCFPEPGMTATLFWMHKFDLMTAADFKISIRHSDDIISSHLGQRFRWYMLTRNRWRRWEVLDQWDRTEALLARSTKVRQNPTRGTSIRAQLAVIEFGIFMRMTRSSSQENMLDRIRCKPHDIESQIASEY